MLNNNVKNSQTCTRVLIFDCYKCVQAEKRMHVCGVLQIPGLTKFGIIIISSRLKKIMHVRHYLPNAASERVRMRERESEKVFVMSFINVERLSD